MGDFRKSSCQHTVGSYGKIVFHTFQVSPLFDFRNVASSLRSLDLSDNQLGKLPLAALSRLKALDWINLHK